MIYKYALDKIPKNQAQELFKYYTMFEKKFGDRRGIEDVIVSKRRFQYEEEVKVLPVQIHSKHKRFLCAMFLQGVNFQSISEKSDQYEVKFSTFLMSSYEMTWPKRTFLIFGIYSVLKRQLRWTKDM